MTQADDILEPIRAYKTQYENSFAQNAQAYFDALTVQSGIDVEQNRSTVKRYNHIVESVRAGTRKLSSRKGLRAFLIVLCVIGFVLALVGFACLVTGTTVAGAILLSVGLAVALGSLLPTVLVLNAHIKHCKQELDEYSRQAAQVQKEAWGQMKQLNMLFDSSVTKTLIESTVPLLKIDDNFDVKRFDYLYTKYGFCANTDANRSTLAVLSGEISGNPFVVDRELVHEMGTKTYTGSITISWTTTERDAQGNTYTQTHSETLTASVTKPKPYYSQQTRLVYGNEAAPDLYFSHEPSHAERLNEKELEKRVRSGEKKIRKLQSKAMSSGNGTFTEMGNSEFDVLFGALDRNNEVQFRLLFTPLAQKNMLTLMKDKSGYGDDFSFYKRGCLNYIWSEHSAKWDMNTDYTRYYSYDYDACARQFVDFNTAYFRSLFYDLAPLLSIPLYQQHKPHEYIYKDVYPCNYTGYEAECAVNRLGVSTFAHPLTATDTVLKADFLQKEGKSDVLKVTAYSYRIEPRVDYESVWGGDGCCHSVPVHWDEYIPVTAESVVKLKGLPLSDKEFMQKSENDSFRTAMDALGIRSYWRKLLCCKVNDVQADFDKSVDDIVGDIAK